MYIYQVYCSYEVQGITDDDVPVGLEGVIGTLEPPKQKNLKVAWRCRACDHEFPSHTFTRLTETLPKCTKCESELSRFMSVVLV